MKTLAYARVGPLMKLTGIFFTADKSRSGSGVSFNGTNINLMARAYDEVSARRNTRCNNIKMIRHIYHDSLLLARGAGGSEEINRGETGSCVRQRFDSGRAACSGGSHYLCISSVKLIMFIGTSRGSGANMSSEFACTFSVWQKAGTFSSTDAQREKNN